MAYRVLRVVALGMACLAVSVPAVAQAPVDAATKGAARNLSEQGVMDFQNQDYAAASEKLERAYTVLKAPAIGLWSARAFVKTNRLVEGYERYLETTRLKGAGGDATKEEQARADAQVELAQLAPRIPTLVVQVEGGPPEEITVTVDGARLANVLLGEERPVNPGSHVLQAIRGDQKVMLQVQIAEGETRTAKLKLDPQPQEPAVAPVTPPLPIAAVAPSVAPAAVRPAPVPPVTSDQSPPPAQTTSLVRTIGWVTLAVGGVGLGMGALTGALAIGKRETLDDSGECRAELRCYPSQNDTVSSYNTLRTVSGVGLIAGGVLAATGVVLLLTAPSEQRQLAMHAAPGSFELRGTF